tara:strand:+ start:209 stop:376 length:168 start_codon:yes stop_codon:yes gene_type:complete
MDKKFKKLYNQICKAAIGVNIGLLLYGFGTGTYQIIPLALVNCLLLSFAFLLDKK